MRIEAWVVVALLAVGCVDGAVKTCQIDANCGGGGTCWRRAGEAVGTCVAAGALPDAGPQDAGTAVDSGSNDAGPAADGGSTVDAGNPCDGVVCGDEWECRPDSTDAGGCVSAFSDITWVRPTDQTSWGADASVDLEVTLKVKAGFAPRATPTSLQLTSKPASDSPFPSVLMRTADGGYQAHFILDVSAANTTWDLTAEYRDAGLSADRTVTTDTHPPIVGLEVFPAPTRRSDGGVLNDVDQATGFDGAFKRSESALVRVSTNEVAAVASTDFIGTFSGAAAPTLTTCPNPSTCPSTACTCFQLDLWKPTFEQYRGALTLALGPIADPAGNRSAGNTKDVTVSRFKWARTLPVDAYDYVMGEDGTLFVRQSRSLSALTPTGEPRAMAFQPLSSQESTSGQSMVLGPWLYQRVLHTGTPSATATTLRVNTATGAVDSALCTHVSAESGSLGSLLVGLRAQSGASNQDTIFSPILASDGGTLLAIRPGNSMDCLATAFAGSTESPQFLVAAGTEVAAAVGGRLARASWNGGWAATGVASYPSSVWGPLAVVDGDVVWASNNGTTADSLSGDAGTPAITYAEKGSSATIGGRSGAHVVYVGSSTLYALPYVEGVNRAFLSSAEQQTTASGSVLILGAGGLGYLNEQSSMVSVRSLTTLATRWSIPTRLAMLPSMMSLDVARDSVGAKVCTAGGVLYGLDFVNTGNGPVPILTAIDVDSPGLDPNDPWPLPLHDPANTANAATPLTPWSCP